MTPLRAVPLRRLAGVEMSPVMAAYLDAREIDIDHLQSFCPDCGAVECPTGRALRRKADALERLLPWSWLSRIAGLEAAS